MYLICWGPTGILPFPHFPFPIFGYHAFNQGTVGGANFPSDRKMGKNSENWKIRCIFPPFSSIFLLVHHTFSRPPPIISPFTSIYPPPFFSHVFPPILNAPPPHFCVFPCFPEAMQVHGDSAFGYIEA